MYAETVLDSATVRDSHGGPCSDSGSSTRVGRRLADLFLNVTMWPSMESRNDRREAASGRHRPWQPRTAHGAGG